MSRLRPLLLALLTLALAGLALAGPVAAHEEEECPEGTKRDCEVTTTTTPDETTTTTAREDEDEVTTTTTKPEPASTTTSSTWRRRATTTTTTTTAAPAPVFSGGGASTSERTFSGTDRTTTVVEATTTAASTDTSLDPLTYVPVDLPTTTRPPVDRSDLETALASTADRDSRSSSIFGISDTVIALVLGVLVVALLGTGGIRRWLDRA